jgi:protein-S-isoprenylcysteine O-methyltransferase Ste14
MTKPADSAPSLLPALLAFIALPGTIAYIVPPLIAPTPAPPPNPLGALVLVAGTSLLLWCVRDFYVAGRGTLAPWSPPRRLVTVGLYRWSRNPMYVAVALVLVGWAVWYRSRGLLIYAAGVCVAFHLRVLLYEEPTLTRMFGDEFIAYRRRVRRWF